MATHFTMKDVNAMEQLAVISALKKCQVLHNEVNDIPKLLGLLKEENASIYGELTAFVTAYRNWVDFWDQIEGNGEEYKLSNIEHNENMQLMHNRDQCRDAFIQVLSK